MIKPIIYLSMATLIFSSCGDTSTKNDSKTSQVNSEVVKGAEMKDPQDFEWKAETVADLGIYLSLIHI